MRSGGFDTLVNFVRPGPLARVGQSRVPGPDIIVAENVPCSVESGQGTERFANAQNAATAPFIITMRREEDVASVVPNDVAIIVETGQRLDIKSSRPAERDPRRDWEVLAVGDA